MKKIIAVLGALSLLGFAAPAMAKTVKPVHKVQASKTAAKKKVLATVKKPAAKAKGSKLKAKPKSKISKSATTLAAASVPKAPKKVAVKKSKTKPKPKVKLKKVKPITPKKPVAAKKPKPKNVKIPKPKKVVVPQPEINPANPANLQGADGSWLDDPETVIVPQFSNAAVRSDVASLAIGHTPAEQPSSTDIISADDSLNLPVALDTTKIADQAKAIPVDSDQSVKNAGIAGTIAASIGALMLLLKRIF
jgi:hypothetical protein